MEEDKTGHSDQDLILLSGWKISVFLFHSITFALCIAFTPTHSAYIYMFQNPSFKFEVCTGICK
jgi:hypothetical protein